MIACFVRSGIVVKKKKKKTKGRGVGRARYFHVRSV